MRVALSILVFALATCPVLAACPLKPAMAVDLVGKSVWVAQYGGDFPVVPRMAADHLGFDVYPKKQVGPERWDTDDAQEPILLGAKGTVLSVAAMGDGYPKYFNVELQGGRTVVLDLIQIEAFDLAGCEPAYLLRNHGESSVYPIQWVTYLPLRLKPGERPVDHIGEWIDDKHLSKIAILDCTAFDEKSSIRPASFDCDPIWRDDSGIDLSDTWSDRPLTVHPLADQVELASPADLEATR